MDVCGCFSHSHFKIIDERDLHTACVHAIELLESRAHPKRVQRANYAFLHALHAFDLYDAFCTANLINGCGCFVRFY